MHAPHAPCSLINGRFVAKGQDGKHSSNEKREQEAVTCASIGFLHSLGSLESVELLSGESVLSCDDFKSES